MLLLGMRSGIAELGEAGQTPCPSCQGETAGEAVVAYSYMHIWYIFGFLTKKTRLIRCRQCGALLQPGDPQAFREMFPRDNIPFQHKNGFLTGLSLAAVAMFINFLFDGVAERRVDAHLASPQPGDVYVADLALIDGSGFGLENPDIAAGIHAHGTLLLRRVEGGKLFFAPSQTANPRLRAVKQSPEMFSNYNLDYSFALTTDEIMKLRESGVISDVRRHGQSEPFTPRRLRPADGGAAP